MLGEKAEDSPVVGQLKRSLEDTWDSLGKLVW